MKTQSLATSRLTYNWVLKHDLWCIDKAKFYQQISMHQVRLLKQIFYADLKLCLRKKSLSAVHNSTWITNGTEYLLKCPHATYNISNRYFTPNLSNIKRKPSWNARAFFGGVTDGTSSRAFGTRPPLTDPNRESRRQKLTVATYLSGLIGVVLLSAVGMRYYHRAKMAAGGLTEVRVPEYRHGRKAYIYEYRGFCLPTFFVNNLRKLHTFDVREDDIWIVSYPKSGTTWVQVIVNLILNDVDKGKTDSKTIDEHIPFLEYPLPGLDAVAKLPSPRVIKTHLPFSLLPNQIKQKKPKIIYIARNPKDTAVSYYWFSNKFLYKSAFAIDGDVNDFARLFVNNKVPYGPWWKHIYEALLAKDDDNVLTVFYEDLQANPHENVKKISEHLGKHLSGRQISQIVEYTSFQSMKDNSKTNYDWMKDSGLANSDGEFMRRGKVGDWKNHLTDELAKQFDEMISTKLPDDIAIRDTLDDQSKV